MSAADVFTEMFAAAVADAREKVIFEGWTGRHSQPGRSTEIENNFTNVFGEAAFQQDGPAEPSVGDFDATAEFFGRADAEKRATAHEFAPQHEPSNKDIGIDR